MLLVSCRSASTLPFSEGLDEATALSLNLWLARTGPGQPDQDLVVARLLPLLLFGVSCRGLLGVL